MAGTPEDLLAENYSRVAARLLESLVEFLSVGRHAYGDLERLLLFVIIAQRAYSDRTYSEAALGSDPPGAAHLTPLSTNILSLAEAASLPRETVRRKINELVDRGVVTRVGVNVALTPLGIDSLALARKALIRFTAQQHSVLAKLLAEQKTP
ncbi:Lrp/AsnC family transcriptional regulator [Phenylobacterium sp.]|uniref:Lrp/AsnC family transcriptional regulator n=1 Tax=Phenylobacterium sp. TaxID=1871053 RepID=UPI00286D0947|nr:Lrp/AsnC family transcriptional regulator [Phenylobacterium sp.]